MNADDLFAQIVRNLYPEGRLRRAWGLTGGVSAQVTALEVERADGETQKMVVRQYGAADLQGNPHIAADESRLLERLHAAGIRVPKPYYFDESGTILRSPYLVVEYIEGKPEFAPADLADFVGQCSAELARIHQVDAASVSFLPDQRARFEKRFGELVSQPHPLGPPLPFKEHHRNRSIRHVERGKYAQWVIKSSRKGSGWIDRGEKEPREVCELSKKWKAQDAENERRIREAMVPFWDLPVLNKPGLLHGDYWVGNLVWKDGRLAAVIDWEDAALGDPLADVANARLEILWAFGREAMVQFTQQYQAMMPGVDGRHLPYWDLCAAWRPLGKFMAWDDDEAAQSRRRERHQWFVEQALEQLFSHRTSK